MSAIDYSYNECSTSGVLPQYIGFRSWLVHQLVCSPAPLAPQDPSPHFKRPVLSVLPQSNRIHEVFKRVDNPVVLGPGGSDHHLGGGGGYDCRGGSSHCYWRRRGGSSSALATLPPSGDPRSSFLGIISRSSRDRYCRSSRSLALAVLSPRGNPRSRLLFAMTTGAARVASGR